eukprot:2064032-Prymnesium_polylepis.1
MAHAHGAHALGARRVHRRLPLGRVRADRHLRRAPPLGDRHVLAPQLGDVDLDRPLLLELLEDVP